MATITKTADLLPLIVEFLEQRRVFAVVTVLETAFSTPVKAGAKAIIGECGLMAGTVGGGQVEEEAQKQAVKALRDGVSLLFEQDLRGRDAFDPNAICGGTMRLLVDVTAPAHYEVYSQAVDVLRRRDRAIWVTSLSHRPALEIKHRVVLESSLRHELDDAGMYQSCLAEGKPVFLPNPEQKKTGDGALYLEPLIPKPILLLAGGGHVAQAVAAQAAWVGFEIVVIEDRPTFTDPALFPPGAKIFCGDLAQQMAGFPIQHDTYVVIATRGHQQDAIALRGCLRSGAGYIGMIGSHRKVPLLRQKFLDSGWATAEEFDRVHAPIGLDIGADDIPEIATSIVAQLIAVRRRGQALKIKTL